MNPYLKSAPKPAASRQAPRGGQENLGAARRFLERVALWAAALCTAVLACAAALGLSVALILRPAPGEWTETVRLGRWQREVSMPTLLRMATHPFTLGLLEGRRLNTRFGPLHWSADARPGAWRVVCAPCSFERSELGRERIVLSRVEFTLERDLQMKLRGTFALGDAPKAVRGRWSARVEADQAELTFSLPDTPMEHAFGLFAGAIPELSRAHIEGRIGLSARLRLPSSELNIKPRIQGFSVSGLGTEALLGAVPACGARRAAPSFGTWLPRAVVAAEDQRFHEHAGYDLNEIMAAWSGNRHSTGSSTGSSSGNEGERPRGASTLSQQLAKLVYTGDRPSHARKLRELLYAVELDRTLGKARVLNLYLEMAPWADGQCGAHAAAQGLLGKPAAALSPVEAAWLASLLRNPNAALAQMVRSGEVDVRRVGAIIDGMRPMSAARRLAAREALETWRPDWLGAPPHPAQRAAPVLPALPAPDAESAPEPPARPLWHDAPDAGPGGATDVVAVP